MQLNIKSFSIIDKLPIFEKVRFSMLLKPNKNNGVSRIKIVE